MPGRTMPLLLLLAASLATALDAQERPRPHIVIFLADDLGWHDVGYHGSVIRTPHLDRLAAAGVRLEQFYVQPVCSPTRSSLMTGRYPIRQGLQVGVIRPWAHYGLPLRERTLAAALHDAGYRTVILGKWHLGLQAPAYLPLARGFDHHYGHYTGAIDYFTHRRMGGLDWHRDGKALEERGYTTELLAREAERLIAHHDPATPLFLYVPFNAPHTPLQAPRRVLDRYAHIKQRKRRRYAAMVACLDDAIGRIVAALARRHLRENTLILFASDNGGPVQSGARNHPLRGRKGTLYEGGVRVPAFAVWPGRLEAGRVVREPLHIVDWYPTLLTLAHASLKQPLPLDGKNAWPTIAAGKRSPHAEILHNATPRGGALRRGDWKLIVRGRPRARTVELYNIATDPGEKQDLSGREPGKVKELLARLEAYRKAARPPMGGRRRRPADFKPPAVWGESR